MMDFTPEERKHYIGGSDVSAIMGLNPWKTPQDVYIEKVSDDPPKLRESEAMYWGKALEESIADRWLNERTKENYHISRSTVLSTGHPTKDYIRGHPDAIYKGSQGETPVNCFLEIKTTDARNAGNWNPNPPPYYFVQLSWYAMINNRNYTNRGEQTPPTEYWFAVLVGGNNYKEFMVDINPSDMDLVESRADKFWENHVKTKTMPTYEEPDERINNFLFPHIDKDKVFECDKFIKDYVDKFRGIKSALKNMQAEEKRMREFIKNKMGKSQYLIFDNQKIASQTEHDRVNTDWEEVAKNYQADSEFNNHIQTHTKIQTIKSLR